MTASTDSSTTTSSSSDFPTVAPTEPAVSTGSYVSLGALVASALVTVGIPVTADQKVWIIGGIALLGPLIAALLIRAKVFSPASVEKMLDSLVSQLDDAKDAVKAARADSRAQEMAHAAALQAVKITVADAIPQALAAAPLQVATGPQEPVYAAQEPAAAQQDYQAAYEPYDAPRQPQGSDWGPRAAYDREATRGYERPVERPAERYVDRDRSDRDRDRRESDRRRRRDDRPDMRREPTADPGTAAEQRGRHGYQPR